MFLSHWALDHMLSWTFLWLPSYEAELWVGWDIVAWAFGKITKHVNVHSFILYFTYISRCSDRYSVSLFWSSHKLSQLFRLPLSSQCSASRVQGHQTMSSFHVPKCFLPHPFSKLQFLYARPPQTCDVLIHIKVCVINGFSECCAFHSTANWIH